MPPKTITKSQRAYHELGEIKKRIGEIMDELREDMPDAKKSKSFEYTNPANGKTSVINGGR